MCCALMLALVIVTVAVAHAQPTPVTTCGQQVTTRRAELTTDLDCTGSDVDAVTMTNGGRLDLNGFTLTADGGGFGNGVVCNRTCKVSGPGTITSANIAAFLFGDSGRIRVDGVTITSSDLAVRGPAASVRDSTVTGNGDGISGTINRFVVVRNSTITGSGGTGVFGDGIRLVDSQVTGSGGACPPMQICCDLVARMEPRVRGTSTCGTSCANTQGAPTWGVCAND
jgi:hypothetical protein